MNETPHERARAVVLWLVGQTGKKQAEIAQIMGYNNKSNFSQMLSGKKILPKQFPHKLAALDERINIDYLLGTSDVMLRTEGGEGNDEGTPAPSAETENLYRDLYKESQEENARLRRRVNQLLDLLQKMGSTCK